MWFVLRLLLCIKIMKMALFGLIGKRNEQRESNDAAAPFLAMVSDYLTSNLFGVNVNGSVALKQSAVYNAITQIAQDLAVLSLDHKVKDANGFQNVVDGPLQDILHSQVNPMLTSYQWRLASNVQALTQGNSYSVIVRDARGNVVGLNLIDNPALVKIYKSKDENGLPVLYYSIPGYSNRMHMGDVIHVKYWTLDGIVGVSPITYHRETIGAQLSADALNKSFWENGGFIKGILKIAGKLSGDRRDEISKQWSAGLKGWHIPVLDAGSDYQPISISQKDAMYIESKSIGVEDIARIFNMPLAKLKVRDIKFANQEQQALDYVVGTLGPLVKANEQEFKSKLLPSGSKQVIKFNLNQLLRGDIDTRSKYYKDMFYMGAMSPNEIRRLEGIGYRDGGDEYFTPVNAYSNSQLDLLIENLKKQGNE